MRFEDGYGRLSNNFNFLCKGLENEYLEAASVYFDGDEYKVYDEQAVMEFLSLY